MKYIISVLSFFLFAGVLANNKPEVVYTTGHTTQINAMVVSKDNKFMASAGNNKLIKVWDMSSGKEFRTITGSDGRVSLLKFKDDNRTLIGTSSENELIGWDIITGEKLFEVNAQGSTKITPYWISDNEILFVNGDNKLSVFNTESKANKILNETLYCNSLNVDFKQNRVIVTNHLNTVFILDLSTLQVITEIPTDREMTNVVIPPQLAENGRLLISVLINNAISILDLDKGKIIFEKKVVNQHVHSFLTDPDKPYAYIGITSYGILIYNYKTQKIITEIKKEANAIFDFNGLALHPNQNILIASNFNLIQLYDTNTGSFFKQFEPRVKSIIDMAYDQKDRYLAISRVKGTVEVWDLQQNKIKLEVSGFFPCEFSPDGSKLTVMNSQLNVVEYDTQSWKISGTYRTNGKLNSLSTYSDNGKYLILGGYLPNMIIYNTETKENIFTINHPMGIKSFDFHPNKKLLAFSDIMGNCKVIDFSTNKVQFNLSISPAFVNAIKFSHDGQYLGVVGSDQSIKLYAADSFKLINEWKGHSGTINGLDFNRNSNVLMTYATNNGVYSTGNAIIFWRLNGEEIANLNAHKSGVNCAFFDLKANYVFSGSEDGSIAINSYEDKKVLATLIATDKKEFIIYTEDNYYMAARDALNSIAFRVGEKLIPFEQFDINLNRPDIVGKVIGKTPANLINAYRYLYQKRLRKYNLDEGNIKMSFDLPFVKIENNIPLSTDKDKVELTIKAWDKASAIKQINVYVNNTPVFGESGIRPKERNKALSFRHILDVTLVNGVNKIDVSCINANGTESLYDSKEIIKTGAKRKNDFYIASIGVSKYQNETFNLTYPTKDATEIAEALQEDNTQYETVHVKYLLNEQVTTENIRNLKHFFEACQPGDVAAIFIAGHGLLDENFDYYFGTYNVDFSSPQNNGLPYSEITKLLNLIKAYKKLLIMDTCHSGELDKEEVKKVSNAEVETGNIKFRSAGSAVSVENAFGAGNMKKLSTDLFSDTRKGSGATVISSSGGAEYAIESDEWQNGLFTYNFIRGVKEYKADLNGDGLIQISEIRTYVNQ